jgi:hypothetical protein
VYALVPSRGIDQEKLSVLNSDFFEELEKLGVPAFDTFKGYKELKPEFISRFQKAIDTRLPFDANVLRVQALEEAIKREHALAVPGPRGIATEPPISPITTLTPLSKENLFRVIQIDKPFIGKNGLQYFGMNWYAAQALLENPEQAYPYGKDTVTIPKKETWAGERSWTETHEKLEIAELEPVFKAKGFLSLEDYYDGHIEVLKKMKDLDIAELEKTEAPYVLQKIKTYLGITAAEKVTSEEAKEEAKLEEEAEEEIEDTREMEKKMEAEEKAPLTQIQPAPTPIVPAPAPRPTRILSSEDMRLLQDYWNTQFIRAIGKVPAGFSSVFRIEFQEVKTLPFAEAKNAILAAADREIGRIEQEQRARATIRQGERITPGPSKTPAQKKPMTDREIEEENEEGGGFANMGNVPPASFPSEPISIMQPFPRSPTSEEKIQLWKVFCYRMRQKGFNCDDFQRPYDDYIEKTQFYDWQELHESFDFLVDTLIEGLRLPPLVQWRKELTVPKGIGGELRELEPSPEPAKLTTAQIEMEERNAVKRQRILIAQKAAGLISYNGYYVGRKQKTMHDLYDEMVSRGVIDRSIPEEIFLPVAKEAIREIYHEPLYTEEWIPIDGEEELTEKLNIGRSAFGKMTERQVEAFLAT